MFVGFGNVVAEELEHLVDFSRIPLRRLKKDDQEFVDSIDREELLGTAVAYADSIETSNGETYNNGLTSGLLFTLLELDRCIDIVTILEAKKTLRLHLLFGAGSLVLIGAGAFWALSAGWLIVALLIGLLFAWDALMTLVNLVRYLRFDRRVIKQIAPIHNKLAYVIEEVRMNRHDPENIKQKLQMMEQAGGRVPSIIYRLLTLQGRHRLRNRPAA